MSQKYCGLKQRDALSPLLWNFPVEYGIKGVQENRIGLELNGKHQLLVYVDDVNHKTSKVVGYDVNSEKTNYMITSRQQSILQGQNIVIENLSFGKMEKFKYLVVTVTNTNDIREKIKRRTKMGNAGYHLRKFYRPTRFPRNWKLRHIEQLYYRLYCMVVKLGPSPWERSID